MRRQQTSRLSVREMDHGMSRKFVKSIKFSNYFYAAMGDLLYYTSIEAGYPTPI
jgi:hypothetical protein